jgi:putative acetyltransferase
MLTIRPERPGDIEPIRYVNKQAFGRGNEARIVEKLRNRGALTLSLVAVQDDEIVGHIAFSPAVIESKGLSFGAITLGPIAVLPAYQHQGIGSQMVWAGLRDCRQLGHEVVVLVGHPEYYPRFGFTPAKARDIECEFEAPDEAWMVLELRKGALAGRRGKAKFRSEFREEQ